MITNETSKEKLVKEPVYNIVEQDEFQARVKQIFQILDDILGKSFGAYGAPTIISNYPYSHATKDGYTIAKNIVFDHVNGSQADRVIAGMAIDICGRLNYAVGDGTTSAIIATNQIYKAAVENDDLATMKVRPKTLMEAFDKVKNEVVKRLEESATQVTDENLVDVIHKIVNVSSNGNQVITDMITEAYKEIGYPAIRCENSDSSETKLVINRGYPTKANLTDAIYINTGNETAEYRNSDVIVFDHRVTRDTYTYILGPLAGIERKLGRHLICLAPSYDEVTIQTIIKRDCLAEYKARTDITLVMMSYPANLPNDKRTVADLAMLLGTELIDRDMEHELIERLEDEHTNIMDLININDRNILGIKKFTNGLEVVPTTEENLVVKDVSSEDNGYIVNMGFAAHLSAKCTDSIFRCEHYNKDLYESTLREAKHSLDEIRKKYEILGTYTQEVYYAQNRYESLRMNTATIFVGGDSALSRDMLKDSVDDAIRAASSAYQFGYVNGCGVTMLSILDQLSKEEHDDFLESIVIDILKDGYYAVFSRVLSNAFPANGEELSENELIAITNAINDSDLPETSEDFIHDSYDVHAIISKACVRLNQVFDLTYFRFNDKIINSVKTDIEILTATIDLLKLLLAGNQAIIANFNRTTDL